MKSKFKSLSQTDGKIKQTSKIENTASEKPKADKKPVCKTAREIGQELQRIDNNAVKQASSQTNLPDFDDIALGGICELLISVICANWS